MEISIHKAAELLKHITGEIRQDEYGETVFMLDDGCGLMVTTLVDVGVHTSYAKVVYHLIMDYYAKEYAPLTEAKCWESNMKAGAQEPDAINFVSTDGTHRVVAQRQLPQHAKLYLTPPTVDAAVEAFRLAAINAVKNVYAKATQTADEFGTLSDAANAIRALPGNTKALEDVCMEVADKAADLAHTRTWEHCGVTESDLRAIVQSVIRKG